MTGETEMRSIAPEMLAKAVYDALEDADDRPGGYESSFLGEYQPGEAMLIDGRFRLDLVAAKLPEQFDITPKRDVK